MSSADRDDDAKEALEALVLEGLDRIESDGWKAVDELCAREPRHAARLRARLEQLRETGLLPHADAAPFPERLGDFRLIERLGGGGMGVVYRAQQISLEREVALKLMRPDEQYFSNTRARFRREVEAIAELSHPAIVRVYTVGEHDGIPYFAMELIEGVALSEIVREFRGRDPRGLSAADVGRLVARACGREPQRDVPMFQGAFVDVCIRIAHELALALSHAHELGVLHRDVKPSNVMLTAHGRVVLLDFGLAARSDATRVTETGAQVGSLAYMAPEQIEGDAERIGPRTDVYGLGVTLYELLALCKPFASDSATALSLEILSSSPRALRTRNRAVSRELELVCQKAMEGRVAQRYETAKDLARDLENVLARRPIQARRSSAWARLGRWTARHPARATAAALAVLVVVGGPLAFSVLERAARTRLEAKSAELAAANALLASALQRSDNESRRATEAIRFLTDVGVQRLAGVPQAEDARVKILEGALQFHRDLVAAREGDPSFAMDAVQSKLQAAQLLIHLNRPAEAEPVLREALSELAVLRGVRSARECALQQGRCAQLLAGALSRQSRNEQALAAADDALAFVAEVQDGALETRELEALCLWRRAELAIAGGEDAAPWWRRCRDAYDALAREFPNEPRFSQQWALACMQTLALAGRQRVDPGQIAGTAGAPSEMDEAITGFERALALLAEQLARDSANIGLRSRIAEATTFLGQAFAVAGQLERAETTLRAAQKHNEELARDLPRTPVHRERLATCTSGLGVVLATKGDEASAIECFQTAVSVAEGLAHDYPKHKGYLAARGRNELNLTQALNSSGRWDEALLAGESAYAHISAYLTAVPGDALERSNLNLATMLWADALEGKGQIQAAVEKLVAMPGPLTSDDQYLRASKLASCASSVAPEGPAELRERCTSEALAALEQAVEQGLEDVTQLEHDAFDALRDSPRFQALVARVRARKP